jgi:hypothetical protein
MRIAVHPLNEFTRCFHSLVATRRPGLNWVRSLRVIGETIASSFSMHNSQILAFLLIGVLTKTVLAQGATQATPPAIVGLAATAFSGGRVIHTAQLIGNATWYAGGSTDSGSVTLTGASAGSSKMQLSLSSLGQKSESQSGVGESASCSWEGNDGVSHVVGNCWRSVLWFLPLFSLQPSLMPSNLQIVDLGIGTVGSSTATYRHVKSQFIEAGAPDAVSAEFTAQSAADLGLDSRTHLPATLVYSQHPDHGPPLSIQFEIQYSDYRSVDGVQIPFHIQRLVNGSLQLDIVVQSAQIN